MSRQRSRRPPLVARVAVFVALAVVFAALFVRLGVWQLDRLAERRARNAELSARLAQPEMPFERLTDTTSYRRVVVTGAPDSANEIVLTGRSRQGSPGVYIATPMRRVSSDTAVIVIRGWVYSPDAATVDLSRWREGRDHFSGYALALARDSTVPPPAASTRRLRTISRESVQRLLPYPVAVMYVVSQDSSSGATPARLPPPALDNGPHLSYAIQWFSFAAIAIVGGGIVAYRDRRHRKNGSPDA